MFVGILAAEVTVGAMVVVVVPPLAQPVVDDLGVVDEDVVEEPVEFLGVDAVGACRPRVRAAVSAVAHQWTVDAISGGGPLIVIPEGALSAWRGADGDGWGFEPASTSFLPIANAFVRWIAADSEEELLGSVDAVLVSAVWEETVTWDVPGPVVLLDSVWPGAEAHEDERLRVEIAAGRYRVQAMQVRPRPNTTLCLVQLVPVA